MTAFAERFAADRNITRVS